MVDRNTETFRESFHKSWNFINRHVNVIVNLNHRKVNYKFIPIFLLLIFFTVAGFAEPETWQDKNTNSYFGQWTTPKVDVDNPEKSTKDFLMEFAGVLKTDHTGINKKHLIESPHGVHLTFEQTWYDIPVYGSQIKVNSDKNGVPHSVFIKTANTDNWPHVDELFEQDRPMPAYADNKNIQDLQKVIFYDNENPKGAYSYKKIDDKREIYKEIVTDQKTGKELFSRELRRFDHHDSLVPVKAKAFMPNPISSADTTYGGVYKNHDNRDTAALNNERKKVEMEVYRTSTDSLFLNGPHVRILDFSPPHNDPAYSLDSTFFYTRSQPWFEEVNTYYHIHDFRKHIDSLGFFGMSDEPVNVDARALSGSDRSYFEPENNRIFLGTGGVPDAEDADVVIHEYGHALSSYAAPGTLGGFQRSAIEEGLCDYYACSYARALQPNRWEDLFNWDGHNEFWAGRTCVSDETLKDNFAGTFYDMGEIWAAALMNIQQEIGRDTTDHLMTAMLFDLASNMNMNDGAKLFLQKDSLIYNAYHADIIIDEFRERGLLEKPNSISTLDENPCRIPDVLKAARSSYGDKLELTFDQPYKGSIEMYDIHGRKLDKSTVVNNNKTAFNTGDLAGGIYIFRFQFDHCSGNRKVFLR